MLLPKNTKYRKQHKGRIHGNAKGNYELSFGFYGLKSLSAERVTARQIEASRRAITRYLKRAGRLWIKFFPDVPVTAKPAEVRMGKGKGGIDRWVCRVKPGTIMFEIDGVDKNLAKKAFELASAKLPVKTSFVSLDQF
jgi:large subunit ribosomal protein L16